MKIENRNRLHQIFFPCLIALIFLLLLTIALGGCRRSEEIHEQQIAPTLTPTPTQTILDEIDAAASIPPPHLLKTLQIGGGYYEAVLHPNGTLYHQLGSGMLLVKGIDYVEKIPLPPVSVYRMAYDPVKDLIYYSQNNLEPGLKAISHTQVISVVSFCCKASEIAIHPENGDIYISSIRLSTESDDLSERIFDIVVVRDDEIIDRIEVQRRVVKMRFNPVDRRLYATHKSSLYPDKQGLAPPLTVIEGTRVVTETFLGHEVKSTMSLRLIAINERTGEMFFTGGGRLITKWDGKGQPKSWPGLDCATPTEGGFFVDDRRNLLYAGIDDICIFQDGELIRQLSTSTPRGQITDMALDKKHDYVYAVASFPTRFIVIRGTEIVKVIDIGRGAPSTVTVDEERGYIYAFVNHDNRMLVFGWDDESPSP